MITPTAVLTGSGNGIDDSLARREWKPSGMTAAAGRYYRAMFPVGFELRSEIDGYKLCLNGRTIATATDLDRGGCRMCRHPDLARHMGYGFAPSRAVAVRYLERWVASWEPELRALYSQPPPRGYFSG